MFVDNTRFRSPGMVEDTTADVPAASPALRRAMSSETTTVPLNLFRDKELCISETMEAKAEVLQRFFTSRMRYWRLREKFRETCQGELSVLRESVRAVPSLSFVQASSHLADSKVVHAASTVLSCCLRDDGLLSFPREARTSRAFLSASMVVHHTLHVLSDGDRAAAARQANDEEKNLGAKLLQIGSKLVLTSIDILSDSVVKKEAKLSSFEFAYNFLAFSRRFLASALLKWKRIDSERLAASITGPYSQAFALSLAASQGNDKQTEMVAKEQLAKMKAAVTKLVGEAKSATILNEVEAAVRVTMEDALRDHRREDKDNGDDDGDDGDDDVAPGNTAPIERRSKEVDKEKEFMERFFANMSVTNERLCHEIILDPTYKIPGSSLEEEEGKKEAESAEKNPALEHAKKIERSMKKAFWDRLMFSLTLPSQEKMNDFKVGAEVQVRYGEHGGFYPATIVAVNQDGRGSAEGGDNDDDDDVVDNDPTFDVRFSDDVIVQKVPFNRFRTSKDSVDYKPLLHLIEEVQQKMLSIAPKKGKHAEEIRANLDVGFLKQMLEKDAFKGDSVQNLMKFICQKILFFQAPVRNRRTNEWIKGYMEEVSKADSCVALLPRLLEWVFERIDETTKDIANSHIDMLRPALAKNGKSYEQSLFNRRLAEGKVRLVNTKIFCNDSAKFLSGGGINGDGVEILRKCVAKETNGFLAFLAAAFVCLLRRPVRLNTPGYETYEGGVPETLLWDVGKLAEMRDVMDGGKFLFVFCPCLCLFIIIHKFTFACLPILCDLEISELNFDDGVPAETSIGKERHEGVGGWSL